MNKVTGKGRLFKDGEGVSVPVEVDGQPFKARVRGQAISFPPAANVEPLRGAVLAEAERCWNDPEQLARLEENKKAAAAGIKRSQDKLRARVAHAKEKKVQGFGFAVDR